MHQKITFSKIFKVMKIYSLLLCLMSVQLFAQSFEKEILIGDWQNVKDSSHHEVWLMSGDSLVGQGLQFKNGKINVWETLKIYSKENSLVYEADVQGNSAVVVFKQNKAGKNEILFSNPEHDFPNFIHYDFSQANRLQVEVYNYDRSKVIKFEFRRLTKVE